MNARTAFARTLTMLAIPLCFAACVADGTEAPDIDTIAVADEVQSISANELHEESIVASDDNTENAGGCLSYVGVVTVKEYECPCWFTTYYDRFYNSCTGTYSDTYLFEKSSCSWKYGNICP